jgi:O-6-methylguanine DNA methyltransferase
MRQRRSPTPELFLDVYAGPLGMMYLTFLGDALVAVDFDRPEGSLPRQSTRRTGQWLRDLEAYFSCALKEFALPVEFLGGTAFERSVWHSLRVIPYGETRSYKWLAESVGRPAAVRAVGQALGKNPLPIVIPCHRIVESGGSLGGYSGGIDIKRRLLDLEYYGRHAAGDGL